MSHTILLKVHTEWGGGGGGGLVGAALENMINCSRIFLVLVGFFVCSFVFVCLLCFF